MELQGGVADVNWSFYTELSVELILLDMAPPPGGRVDWHANANIPSPTAGATSGSLHWEMHRILPPLGDPPDGFLPDPKLVSARGLTAQPTKAQRTWADMAKLVTEIIKPRNAVPAHVTSCATVLGT